MKKILILMCILASLTTQAQDIKNGSKWNISNLEYEAKVNNNQTITFTAMAEGEELTFRLTPNKSKKNEFVIGEQPNADGFNPYNKASRAKLVNEQGWKLLCLYDKEDRLLEVLDGSFFGSGEKVAMGKWMQQIMGNYTDKYGDKLQIGDEVIYKDGIACATFENIPFNGTVTGVIKISGNTHLDGTWEFVQTLQGLTLFEVEQDEYGFFKRTGEEQNLDWVDTEPRFGYASIVLLNDKQFRKMDKTTLRVMRNAILAKHGYMMSSPDLVDYFGSKPWFSPRPSNDGVFDELGIVERLNIELIKTEEANR